MRTVFYHSCDYLLLLRDLPLLEERPLLRDLLLLDPPLILRELLLLRELPLDGACLMLRPRLVWLDELERLLIDEPVEPRVLLDPPESDGVCDLRLRFASVFLIRVLDLWTSADLRLLPKFDL